MSNHIDNIIEKYWAGETSLAEETAIMDYVASGQVSPEHEALVPLFGFYKSQSGMEMGKALDLDLENIPEAQTATDALVDKYWAAATSLEEEGQLKRIAEAGGLSAEQAPIASLMAALAQEGEVKMTKKLDLSFVNEVEVTPKYRRLMPKIMSVAASLAILLMVAFNFLSEDTQYQNKYTEIQNPDEALEITMEALAFLSHKYDKGAQPMKYIKELERTDIFSISN